VDLSEYIEIAGVDVKDSQRAFVTANIAKARYQLESALGFPLTAEKAEQNLYTETGQAPDDNWVCGGSDADLLPAESEPDAIYRVFTQPDNRTAVGGRLPMSSLIQIDPCTAISKIKLVHGTVNVHTFTTSEQALLLGPSGYGRMVNLEVIFPYPCRCGHYLQVAVSADWLGSEENQLPDDLLSVWADLVTWLSDRTRNIKSENRGTRSYTKAESKSPIEDPINKSILESYAGPGGRPGGCRYEP
jgi:hypothetical protein